MIFRILYCFLQGVLFTLLICIVCPELLSAQTSSLNKINTGTSKVDSIVRPLQANLYVLSIGTKSDLNYPQQDARAFARLFSNQAGKGKLFRHVRIDTLIGPAATGNNILKVLTGLTTTLSGKNDVLIIFISGHAMVSEYGVELIGSRSETPGSKSRINFTNDILARLKGFDCKKIIFIDACHSGGIAGRKSSGKSGVSEAINELIHSPNALAIFSSCSAREDSFENKSWGHGVFTQALIEGLQKGKADINKKGIIYIDDLFNYVRTRVPQLLKKTDQLDSEGNPAEQHPTGQNQIGNIPFYLNIKNTASQTSHNAHAESSISVRTYFKISPDMRKIPLQTWEEKASRFLQTYFGDRYHNCALLTSQNPPTEILKHVKGYVTHTYWENVQVKLDNIQVSGNHLMIQCSIDGQYVKLTTTGITEAAFDRSCLLEKDYRDEMQNLGISLIDSFYNSLHYKPCLKAP
ncbi:MAG: caspase family protein [Chitinophagaceae bacterium]|nr:caspase family protein [Chitinophagaceae bacterium]